jgi:peptidoglycan hydrolase CwlO-like protein
MAKNYVIKLGGNLYVASRFYNLYPVATNDISKATIFTSVEDAEKVAKGTIGGKIEELVDENEDVYNELKLAKTRIAELENELNKANKIIGVLTEKLEDKQK